MSSQAIAASDASVRARTERVHATMLVELLALLVFIAMAFAFVQKEDADRINPWRAKYDQLQLKYEAAQKQIASLGKSLRALELQNKELTALTNRLMADHTGTLAANDQLSLPKKDVDALYDRIANLEQVVQAQQADNAGLRAKLGGRGGTDLPICPVTGGFLVRVHMLADGNLRVERLWPAGADPVAKAIPGLAQLTSGGSLSRRAFGASAAQVAQWGKSQTPKCGFKARVVESHGNLALYKRQVATVEQYFYVRKD